MQITNSELIRMINTLNSYSNTRLPQSISFAITRNIMILMKEYECYDEALKKVLLAHQDDVVKDAAGEIVLSRTGTPVMKDDASAETKSEVADLLNQSIDVNMHSISFDEFNYRDGDRYDPLSPDDMLALKAVLCQND